MKVVDIIKLVRWCIDEEAGNTAGFANASAYDFDNGTHTDNGMMNNIIRAKIADALRWVCLNAHSSQLSVGSPFVIDGTSSQSSPVVAPSNHNVEIIKEDIITEVHNNIIALNSRFLRLIRVRGENWHRAILGEGLLSEDSEEYVQVHSTDGAEATIDRPQAALINTKLKSVEVWPATDAGAFTITYAVAPSSEDISLLENDDTEIFIPQVVESAFVYYIAYLLLSAYGDGRAEKMLDIAKRNVGSAE